MHMNVHVCLKQKGNTMYMCINAASGKTTIHFPSDLRCSYILITLFKKLLSCNDKSCNVLSQKRRQSVKMANCFHLIS